MSKTLSMSFFPSEGNTVKAFASLVRRITSDTEVNSIKWHKKYYRYESEQIGLDTLMSILESPESQSLAESKDSFAVQLGYTTASGELIPLDIDFHGKGYMDGHYARNNSSMRITVEDSGLWRMMKSISRDMSWTGLDAPEHLKAEAVEKANRDSELLFLIGCGFFLKEDSTSWKWEYEKETYIDHGAMYYESGWSCPLRCQMVYHKDPQEFAKDFERIYADYHWGITMPSKLPVSYIKEVFSAVAETELPEVRFHDFGEPGAVLIGAANLSVWRAYRYLAELASDYIDSE